MTNQEKADIARKVAKALDLDDPPNLDWPDYQLRTTQDGRVEQVED